MSEVLITGPGKYPTRRADEREKLLKTARLRRPDGEMRPPIVWHTLDVGQPDDDATANWDWVDETLTAAAFVAVMGALVILM